MLRIAPRPAVILAAIAIAFAALPAKADDPLDLGCVGTDPGGYRCEAALFQWEDMTGATTVALDNDLAGPISIGFTYRHYGVSRGSVYLAMQGRVCFVSTECANPWLRLHDRVPGVACGQADFDAPTARYKRTPGRFTVEYEAYKEGKLYRFQTQLTSSHEAYCMIDSLNTGGGTIGVAAHATRLPDEVPAYLAYADDESVVTTQQGLRFYCPSNPAAAPQNFDWEDWPTYEVGKLSFYWEYPSTDGCNKVTAYRVFTGPTESQATLLTEFPIASAWTYWTDENAPVGASQWTYVVAAVTAKGEGARVARTFTLPGAPQGVQALPSNVGEITVTWESTGVMTGLRPLEHRVYRDGTLVGVVPYYSGYEFIDGAAPFGFHSYTVVEVNGLGPGPESLPASGFSTLPPGTSEDVTILPGGTYEARFPTRIGNANCVRLSVGDVTLYTSRLSNMDPTTWFNPGTPIVPSDRC